MTLNSLCSVRDTLSRAHGSAGSRPSSLTLDEYQESPQKGAVTGCRVPLYKVLRGANQSSQTLSYSRKHPTELTGDKGSTFSAIHQLHERETAKFTLRAHGNNLEASSEEEVQR